MTLVPLEGNRVGKCFVVKIIQRFAVNLGKGVHKIFQRVSGLFRGKNDSPAAAVQGDAEKVVAVPEKFGPFFGFLIVQLQFFNQHGLAHVGRVGLHPPGAGEVKFAPAMKIAGYFAIFSGDAQTENVAGGNPGRPEHGDKNGCREHMI